MSAFTICPNAIGECSSGIDGNAQGWDWAGHEEG